MHRGHVVTRPNCGPVLISSRAVELWVALTQQGLCSHRVQSWATPAFVPRSKVLGTHPPQGRQRLFSHEANLWADIDFVSRSEALGTPNITHNSRYVANLITCGLPHPSEA